MPITTKVYANMLAVQYGKRLDAEKLRRIVEARSVGEALKILGDLGFYYAEGATVDGTVVAETDKLIEFVEENAPSERVKSAMLARFLYNNAKLAYKSRFIAVPEDGYYRTPLDVQSIKAGDYSDCDEYMAAALEELDAQKEDKPQNIDLALTRAMYKSVLGAGGIVRKYFRAEIDMKNILTAARVKRLGIKTDEWIEGGKLSRQVLEDSVTEDSFAESYEFTPYAEFAQSIEDHDMVELWRAERDADDYLYFMTDSDVKAFTSYAPFLNYYTESLIELKTIKTALVCVKTNSRDSFYARIPEIYK